MTGCCRILGAAASRNSNVLMKSIFRDSGAHVPMHNIRPRRHNSIPTALYSQHMPCMISTCRRRRCYCCQNHKCPENDCGTSCCCNALLCVYALAGSPFFTALIMPYSIRPRSKARCMRSRVTISRSVRYQIRGPLNTTIHGSQTPTQIECLQLSIVCGFQSSATTDCS